MYGSHKSNLPCPQEVRYYQTNPAGSVTQVPMRAGDMLLFTEALTHGTYPGTASHHRRALLYKYSPGHMTWGRSDQVTQSTDGYTERQALLLEDPNIYKRRIVPAQEPTP